MTLMKIKDILDECFQDYKKISMLISVSGCDWKCCKEAGIPISVCQNSELSNQKTHDMCDDDIIKRYLNNNITNAIIIAGLEPMLQYDEVYRFIHKLREQYGCYDDVVIYTGYYPEEIEHEINELSKYKNIIMKFGRFVPGSEKIHDDVLGIDLISNNQFAKKIS